MSQAAASLQIEVAHDADTVLAVLEAAAQWTQAQGARLWSEADLSSELVHGHVAEGRYFAARASVGDEVAGVMRIDLEDPHFWPEIAQGSSAYVHKLAVARAWAGRGVSTALLDFAVAHTRGIGRAWLRLDCVAERAALRRLYEGFGFRLHSEIFKGRAAFARYALPVGA